MIGHVIRQNQAHVAEYVVDPFHVAYMFVKDRVIRLKIRLMKLLQDQIVANVS